MSIASPAAPGRNVQSGSHPKTTPGALTVFFETPFPAPPVVVVAPYWEGATWPVGFPETLTAITPASFTVTSNNAAENYYVSWIACAP
ncbi:MAG TPA: hypothetical protein VHG91_17740 [Longimicrobium sp.]|nr:hypothetical protein [Longimicrobium sp.]